MYEDSILKPKQVLCIESVYLKKDVMCVLQARLTRWQVLNFSSSANINIVAREIQFVQR